MHKSHRYNKSRLCTINMQAYNYGVKSPKLLFSCHIVLTRLQITMLTTLLYLPFSVWIRISYICVAIVVIR